jgi:ribosomal protein S27E
MKIIKEIRQQLAHCMAFYGDQPEELMYKLETLVIEWYGKGLESGKAIDIKCPHCNSVLKVYHMDWTAIKCLKCGEQINQGD